MANIGDPQPAVNTPVPAVKTPRLPPRLKIALLIFALASGAAVAILPAITQAFGNVGGQPSIAQLAVTGVAMIILTSVLLAYAGKEIGLNRAWLLLAIIYNAIIVIIKFVISPASLYGQTITLANIGGFDPNTSGSYIFVAALVMCLYAGVLGVIYLSYKKRVSAVLTGVTAADRPHLKIKTGFLVFLAMALFVVMGGAGILLLPLLFAGAGLSYLSYVFAGMGLVLLAAIALGIIFAIGAYGQAAKTAVEVRDGAVLATFFWLGLSLILIVHILWVIYMTVMLSIWPFKTISPSGK